MKHIIFSGAGGYIGSHTAYCFLANTSCRITIIDNLSTGFIENIHFLQARFKDRVRFIQMDLLDTGALDSIFAQEKFDAIVHFAASLIVPESTIKPLLYYSNNTKNTLQIIELCVKHNINNFIFSSTAAVYGDALNIPVREDAPLAPINPYGTSKMMSELILQDTARAHKDFHYVALRYFNVAGALGENNYNLDSNSPKNRAFGLGSRAKEATHLIKVACECATNKRESMNIFGRDYPTKDGTCIRDYIHIDDLASAHLSAFEYLQSAQISDIFNVGYGHGFSVQEIIQKVKEISGVNFKTIDAPRRAGDTANLIADNSKILKHTNWTPKFDDINYIIKSALDWEKCLS